MRSLRWRLHVLQMNFRVSDFERLHKFICVSFKGLTSGIIKKQQNLKKKWTRLKNTAKNKYLGPLAGNCQM
jgi:hypothetical protein